MDTKSFEIMIHSQYAYDFCRDQVTSYEECRQTDTPLPKDPALCKTQARELVGCYKQAEKMEPACLDPFNDARECMFKSDGSVFNCKQYLHQYAFCQARPNEYLDFLKNSTSIQKQPKKFNFAMNRGTYDVYQ